MKKLVLDLDETLIYSTMEPVGPNSVRLIAADMPFYTMLRPGTQKFIEFVCQKFEVTVWSTGMQEYIEAVWQYIVASLERQPSSGSDFANLKRSLNLSEATLWGRDFCKKITPPPTDGSEPYEKPLRQITDDLTQIAIIDNTPTMFTKYPVNGIQAKTWRGDPNDTELYHLIHYLTWLETQPSMQRDHRAWRLETLCWRSR